MLCKIQFTKDAALITDYQASGLGVYSDLGSDQIF